MIKTKTILFLIATSLLIIAAIGVAYAQYVNAQTNLANNYTTQTPQGYNGNYGYLPPNYGNSYSPYPQQGFYPYGMGMHGRCW